MIVILHAMTINGPLVHYDDLTGKLINDLNSVGDTCHPNRVCLDSKTTCETLWVSQSHSKDYHDNMNRNIFMLWVHDKMIPTFESSYPRKVMVLVVDYAPYHKSCVIGSLAMLKNVSSWISLRPIT